MRWKVSTIVLAVALVLVSCNSKAVAEAEEAFRMQYEESHITLAGMIYLYRDAATGVEYIIVKDGEGLAITPRVKKEYVYMGE